MAKRAPAPTTNGMIRVSLFVRPGQLTALRAVQARAGVPMAEQIRRAIDATLGVKPAGRRGGPR